MIEPPHWSDAQLRRQLARSIESFRRERQEEDVSGYHAFFDTFQGHFEDLLEKTIDLTELEKNALDILSDKDLRSSFRYLAGPPISEDDLQTIAEAVFSPSRLAAEPAMVERVVQVIMSGLDRRRFPWVAQGREPDESEKQAAIIASAALMATQRIGTSRRSESKSKQEAKVEERLISVHFKRVPNRPVLTLADAPKPGEFCGESIFGTRKADFIVGLWDNRIMPVECKASNSQVNSIKRLKNDAAVKATVWRDEFGRRSVVPTAVLSGVYGLAHLKDAQGRGLALFWAHDLQQFVRFIQRTKKR